MAFGLLLSASSLAPTIVSNPLTKIQPILAQSKSQFSMASNDTVEAQNSTQEHLPKQEGFSVSVLATNLSQPYNILYGPDDALWITERVAKNITRVDPNNGSKLNSMPVPNVHQSAGQDGLMGMAFDPDFNNTHHIYVAYTYDANPGEEFDRRTKITRFTYDPAAGTIGEPADLINGLSGSTHHNSGRMTFGLDGKLYYSIGDQGKNYLRVLLLKQPGPETPNG